MAEFTLRPGPYKPAVAPLRGWRTEHGSSELATRVYEGPQGPLEVYLVDDLKATVVKGAGMTSVRLAWGPHVKSDHSWVERLRDGIGCQVDGVPVAFRQHRFGVTRNGRALRIRAGDRDYVYRLRRFATFVIERADGAEVARYDRRKDGGWVHDDVDRAEAVIVALVVASSLVVESRTLRP